jgi:hypothetical protein
VTAVSARHSGPIPDVDASTVPAEQRRRHRSGFWAVVFAFLIVMAVATLPSPLHGLYRTRDADIEERHRRVTRAALVAVR